MQVEIWKDIPSYEGIYQASTLGYIRNSKGRILKAAKSPTNHKKVCLSKGNKSKTIEVHQLLAITFLNHIPNGITLVVDHINEDPSDNRLENLQIITHRENVAKSCRLKGKHVSKYTGVTKDKSKKNPWRAKIKIDGKTVSLGQYPTEEQAHKAYQAKLKEIS